MSKRFWGIFSFILYYRIFFVLKYFWGRGRGGLFGFFFVGDLVIDVNRVCVMYRILYVVFWGIWFLVYGGIYYMLIK